MLAELIRFVENLTPQSTTTLRGDRTGALVTTPGHPFYAEMVYQNNVWVLNTPPAGVTLNANNVFSAAISTPVVGLWNPPQSKRIAVISRIITQWNSGNVGAGGLAWAFVSAPCNVTAASNGTEINVSSLTVGSGCPFKTYINSQMTGIGSANILRYIGGPSIGNIAANGNHTYSEECSGDIFCPPGTALGVFAVNAGNNPVVHVSIVFESMPI